MKRFCQRHYLLASLLGAWLLGITGWLALACRGLAHSGLGPGDTAAPFALAPLWGGFLALFFVYPLVLTGIEFFLLLRRPLSGRRTPERVFDAITLALGPCYSILYLAVSHGVVFHSQWDTVLVNSETHPPMNSDFMLTVFVLALVGLAGYLALNYLPLEKLPPLIIVMSIAGMYLACGVGIIWSVQVFQDISDGWLLLLPLNVLFITARTIRAKMAEWNALPRETPEYASPLLTLAHKALCKSQFWPLLALLLMWPLLGGLIGVLSLFGQAPSAAIKAWTETSDWNLSQRVAPQNIYQDEHYLCTVAAGGHKRVVKPQRLGVRHGHQVIVNRQLCVANAFEQVLEERTPRFHRAVRHFYDTYGFPIAKLIHSPYLADIIYFLMKPLEWLFLIVLYTVDIHPEDRIAVQYTGKNATEFQ